MMIRERRKGALILGLLWLAAVGATILIFRSSFSGVFLWIFLPVTFILMILGLVVYLGGIMLLAGFNTMSDEERAGYDEKEVTSFMGMFLVLASYIFLLAAVSFMMILVFVAAVVIMLIYINTSKRFKAGRT